VILENLGCVAMCLGDLDRATELFAEGQSLATESGDMHTIASAGRARARVLLLQGDIDHATELVEESLALTRELAEPHGLADCLDVYGGVAAARHDPALAAALFGAADALREQIGATRAPDHYVWFDGAFAAAKAELNEAEFGAAYERGRRLSLERALEEAVRLGAGTRS
jgi:ATP/maltotriose-dependent transcriptional regulator MalT